MPSKQLRMFEPYRPLADRLGVEFFRSTPSAPGVYTMLGSAHEILYIGQSSNLRHRLASYKNAQAGQSPRKVFRLAQKVERIVWTVCPSPEAAVTLEAHLIRRHRPAFNRQHTWPATWFYLGLSAADDSLAIRLHNESPPDKDEILYGAFKGISQGRRILKSLARLSWCLEHQPDSPLQFPHPFSHRLEQWTWPKSQRLAAIKFQELLTSFLEGKNLGLIETGQTQLNLPDGNEVEQENRPMIEQILLGDLEELEDFFHKGPARVAAQAKQGDASSGIIPPEDQDPTRRDWVNFPPRMPASVLPTVAAQGELAIDIAPII